MTRYSYAKGTDDLWVVTGVDGSPLYGMNGLSAQHAIDIAWHLNVSFDQGRREVRNNIKELLGVIG